MGLYSCHTSTHTYTHPSWPPHASPYLHTHTHTLYTHTHTHTHTTHTHTNQQIKQNNAKRTLYKQLVNGGKAGQAGAIPKLSN